MKFLLATTVALASLNLFAQSAIAQQNNNAVSAPNGKVSVTGGWDAMTGNPGSLDLGGSAAFAVPLGDRFGFQGDIAVGQFAGTTSYSAAGHLFTRDPNAYLIGLVGAAALTSNSSNLLIGPEAEAYIGPFTVAASGGYVASNLAGVASNNFYANSDLRYYPDPNLKLELGAATFAGVKTAHLGMEWQISDTRPISVTANTSIGDNNLIAANVGLTFYFGGTSNTLIDRHRHEDPVNLSTLLLLLNGAYYKVTVPTGSFATNTGTCPAGFGYEPILKTCFKIGN